MLYSRAKERACIKPFHITCLDLQHVGCLSKTEIVDLQKKNMHSRHFYVSWIKNFKFQMLSEPETAMCMVDGTSKEIFWKQHHTFLCTFENVLTVVTSAIAWKATTYHHNPIAVLCVYACLGWGMGGTEVRPNPPVYKMVKVWRQTDRHFISSGGRTGHPLIGRSIFWFLAPPIHMSMGKTLFCELLPMAVTLVSECVCECVDSSDG